MIIILLILYFFIHNKYEQFTKCLISDKDSDINRKSIKYLKPSENYCLWNKGKCKLPLEYECDRDSDCISNNCYQGVCKYNDKCGTNNYAYLGKGFEKKISLSPSQCNEECSRNKKCDFWNWSRTNKTCVLKNEKNVRGGIVKNNIVGGMRNSCSGGNINCQVCFRTNNSCPSDTNINICSYNNKLIKASSEPNLSNNISYFNDNNPKIGKINCNWSSPIFNGVSLNKCRDIASTYKRIGKPVEGITIEYPSIKSNIGWCGPDSELLVENKNRAEMSCQKAILKNKRIKQPWLEKGYYQMKGNSISNDSEGNLIIKTARNPQGIKVSKEKASSFTGVSSICISGKPINPYSDVQAILGTRKDNSSLFLLTSLNTEGINVPADKAYLYSRAKEIYLSPHWSFKNVNSYPNCISECQKNVNCGGVRWLKDSKICDMMKSCKKTNNDNRWRHWVKQNNFSKGLPEWTLVKNGIPKYGKITDYGENKTLEYCQTKCTNQFKPIKCNSIVYSQNKGHCLTYSNSSNIMNNPNYRTYSYKNLSTY